MDRKKSVEKDERSSKVGSPNKPPKKSSPEKEEKKTKTKLEKNKLVKSPETEKKLSGNKSPEAARLGPTSPESRRLQSGNAPEPGGGRPSRSSSKIGRNNSKPSLTTAISLAPTAPVVPSNKSLASMPLSTTLRPRTPFVVKDTSVECDIFNRETLIAFLDEKVGGKLMFGPCTLFFI